MSIASRIWSRLRAVVFRSSLDREMQREWAFHLDARAADLVDAGLSQAEAERQARAEFGAITKWQEESREARGLVWLDDLRTDVAYALRQMVAAPGFTLTVVMTLALGIGANTAVFSVINGVLLRPLPFPDADRLVRVVAAPAPPPQPPDGVSLPEMLQLRDRARSLSHIGLYAASAMTMTTPDIAVRLDGISVSPTLLELLAPRPALGRIFTPAEETAGADAVVVLSHATWQQYFGGRPDVIGQAIQLEARDYTVVGVLDRTFRFPDAQTQFFVPFALGGRGPQPRFVRFVARLSGGWSAERALEEITDILGPPPAAAVTSSPPPPSSSLPSPGAQPIATAGTADATSARAAERQLRLVRLHDEIVGPVRPALRVLAVAVAAILLTACVNVVNLLLARSTARRREMAVRIALGAGRGRLTRQIVTEGVLLAAAGGVTAVGFAAGGIGLLGVIGASLPRRDLGAGAGLPRLDEIAVDPSALWFTLAVSLVTGLLFGLVPAGQHTRIPLDALRGGPDAASGFRRLGHHRVRGLLVSVQIAMAVMLAVGGGLLIRSFASLSSVDPGYDPDRVLTFHVSLAGGRAATNRLPRFAEDLAARLSDVPGVRAAAYTEHLPLAQRQATMPLRKSVEMAARVPPPPPAPGESALPEFPLLRMVSRDYFTAMGMRIASGRGFSMDGRTPALVINETLARSGFFDGDPVGQHVYGMGPTPWQVIGIVEDVRHFGLDQAPGPQVFVDSRQALMNGLAPTGAVEYFVVRTDIDPNVLVPVVRDLARQLDPLASVDNVATMEQIVANAV